MVNGLGDLQYKDVDAVDTYFDIVRQGVRIPRRRWIVKPEWEPKPVQGMEAVQKFFDDHAVPRLWQLATDMWTRLQCGTYFVKSPNWIEPPITARGIDVRTVSGTGTPLGLIHADITVLTFTVPDRFVGTLLSFGHEIDVTAEWANIDWTIRVNRAPLPYYNGFRQQIGTFVDPTEFGAPFRLKPQDVVEVIANQQGAVAVNAFARLKGFMFPVRQFTQDGSYAEYHTI